MFFLLRCSPTMLGIGFTGMPWSTLLSFSQGFSTRMVPSHRKAFRDKCRGIYFLDITTTRKTSGIYKRRIRNAKHPTVPHGEKLSHWKWQLTPLLRKTFGWNPDTLDSRSELASAMNSILSAWLPLCSRGCSPLTVFQIPSQSTNYGQRDS